MLDENRADFGHWNPNGNKGLMSGRMVIRRIFANPDRIVIGSGYSPLRPPLRGHGFRQILQIVSLL
jgi:hypothetical protein